MFAQEREEKFKQELRDLLKKWDTELEIEETGEPWARESTMKVFLQSKWVDNVMVDESVDIDLGSFIDGV